ncbi:MAG TPA: hypothetical protein VJ882_03350 [Desulfuromonadales bacterium]|nr:hypothetical protein [Desulfuromonadales bacterium]
MNHSIALGIFAIYVVVVTLVQLLAQRDIPRLLTMKRIWGRSRGLLVHFLTEVIMPLLFGIVYLARGLSSGF